MSSAVHLGISTCPNDTFAFHGLMERKVDWRGLEFQIELRDVEELNQRLFAGEFDAAKASFHAAVLLADKLGVFASGSALGYGVGPLLLAARKETHPSQPVVDESGETRPARILCPGKHTTAALLYHLFHPRQGNVEHVVFSDIMPALQHGEADFGVCIHEGRFTWQEQGLAFVEDLGTLWEKATETPLPLGGILGRLSLGEEKLHNIQQVIRDSVEYGLAHRDEMLPTMRRYAQELSDNVMFAHVDLYVNQWTRDLGDTGRAALNMLAKRSAATGLLPERSRSLQIIQA